MGVELRQLKQPLLADGKQPQQDTKAITQTQQIDFNKLLGRHRNRTETTFPFTVQQVEDCLFVDEKTVVALEYILYQKDEDYRLLKNDNDMQLHHLGTDDYMANLDPRNSFQDKPLNLKIASKDYLSQHKQERRKDHSADKPGINLNALKQQMNSQLRGKLNKVNFMETEDGDDAVVEGIISLWNINANGQITKDKEISFEYDTAFQPSEENKMRLTLSHDRKIVSLTIQKVGITQHPGFKVQAWYSNSLKPVELSRKFHQNLFKCHGVLLEATFVGKKNQFFFLKSAVKHSGQVLHKSYFILNTKSGDLLLNYETVSHTHNADGSTIKGKIKEEKNLTVKNETIFMLELLICEKVKKRSAKHKNQDVWQKNYQYGSEDDEDNDTHHDESDDYGNEEEEDHQGEDEEPHGEDEENKELEESKTSMPDNEAEVENDLDLVFFFAGRSPNNDLPKGKIMLTKQKFKLAELLTIEDPAERKETIIARCREKLHTKMEVNKSMYWHLPEGWFISKLKKEKIWRGQIRLATNKNFHKFSIIHPKGEFMVFHQDSEEIDKVQLPSNADCQFARSQQTKDEMFLIIMQIDFGTTATCFYGKNQRKTLTFKNNHIFAIQDVIHQRHPSYDQMKDDYNTRDLLMMQSITITKGDQEIEMKTEIPSRDIEQRDNATQFVTRKCISQRLYSMFPVMMYNIGQRKLIIKNSMSGGASYVYEVPRGEKFISFVEFNSKQDIGFYPNQLRLELCSHFAFLTHERKSNQAIVNLLFIDPYYDITQIALFKSTKRLDWSKNKDIIIKNFLYPSMRNADHVIKCLTQFPDNFSVKELRDVSQDEQNSAYDSELDKHSESEEDDDAQLVKQALIDFQMDNHNHIYYVQEFDGQLIFKEIHPDHDEEKNHIVIYEIKSEKILGFQIDQDGDTFYFIDQFKVVNKLQRIRDSKLLTETAQFMIKDKDLPHFNESGYFPKIIVNNRFLLWQSKIFYLFTNPLQPGILDMEELEEIMDSSVKIKNPKKQFTIGPIRSIGSCDVNIVFQYSQKLIYKALLFQQPDSLASTMVADSEGKVEFTTFMDNDKVLLKIANRFMVFDNIGKFIDEVEFKDLKKAQLKEFKQRMAENQERWHRLAENIEEHKQVEVIQHTKPEQKNEINFWNRLRMINVSQNNLYYLFEDRKKNNLCIYMLANKEQDTPIGSLYKKRNQDGGKAAAGATEETLKKKPTKTKVLQDAQKKMQNRLQKMQEQMANQRDSLYWFEPLYQIDVDKLELFKIEEGLITEQMSLQDKLKALRETVTCKIANNGDVVLCRAIHDYKDESDNFIRTVGCQIKEKGKKINSFSYVVQFDPSSKRDIMSILSKREKHLKTALKKEQLNQKLLPMNFRDLRKTKMIQKQIKKLETTTQNVVVCDILFSNMFVVACGREIKFIKLKTESDEEEEVEFKKMAIDFGPQIEIHKIWSTGVYGHVQIVAKDETKNTMIVATWDTINNIEASMFQYKCAPDTKPENYIVKGINQKYNYFVNEYQIFDLEYNIPLQTTTNNSMRGDGVQGNVSNRRLIYWDGTRTLSIDKPNLICFPYNRLDVKFWQDISHFDNNPSIINENTTLTQFNTVYEGQSLFHYFAESIQVVEMIHNKYINAKENKTLTEADVNMPLVILHPDHNGQTALDKCIQIERPKSFELMVNLLEPFQQYNLSQMMLSVFPYMIKQGTDTILKFLNSGVYIPVMMQEPLICSWPSDLTDHIFPAHTVLISETMVKDELKSLTAGFSFADVNLADENYQNLTDDVNDKKKHREQILLEKRKNLRPQTIRSNKTDEDNQMKRVRAEALDLDWVFKHNNIQVMLKLLTSQNNSQLYATKAVRIFIDMLWIKYQPQIIKRVFLPYMAYLGLFVFLCSNMAGDYLKSLNKTQQEDEPNHVTNFLECLLVSVACLFLWSGFFIVEWQQLKVGKWDYLLDYWNFIDLSSLVINFIFILMLNIDVLTRSTSIVPVTWVRTIGGFACWILWIKVFYWMRLFKQTAQFITLIKETLIDIKMFALMVVIIMLAFANFFYIMNLNQNGVVVERTGNSYIDAFLMIYLLALGEFGLDGFDSGIDVYIVWIFFGLASFLVIIVFMNMLIAIMGDTFERVQSIKEVNAIMEQANLIQDHVWLLDLKEVFPNKRHIVLLTPDNSNESQQVNLETYINQTQNMIIKKIENIGLQTEQAQEAMEIQNRQMNKSLQTVIVKIKQMLFEHEKDLQDMEYGKEDDEDEEQEEGDN